MVAPRTSLKMQYSSNVFNKSVGSFAAMASSSSHQSDYPDYDALPIHPATGKRSARGVWDRPGHHDHLGGTIEFSCSNAPQKIEADTSLWSRKALNHLTPDTRLAAVKEVTYGLSFQLDWAYHMIGKPPFGRKGLEHKLIHHGPTNGPQHIDDEVAFNTQAGSQWDGFMHYPDQQTGEYYNGFKPNDKTADEKEEAVGAHSTHCEFLLIGTSRVDDGPLTPNFYFC